MKSTTLIRAESPSPYVGGVVVVFPSGACKQVRWERQGPILPTLDAAKKYAASLLQHMLDEGHNVDCDATNWASVAAALKRCLEDHNDRFRGRAPYEHR